MTVCFKCIGDEYLSGEIESLGKRALCDFCGKQRRSYTLEDVAQRVRDAIENNYRRHQDEFGADDGEPIVNLIAELLSSSEDVAEAIRSCISEDTAYEAHDSGESDPFSSESCYVDKPADTFEFHETWGFFRQQIRTRSRYFGETTKRALQDIFGDLSQLKGRRDEPVVRTVGPGTDLTHAYRARIAFSERDLEAMLKAPARELGPPPAGLARAGRMNAKGISVFYGAIEKETCMAEARAPVGSQVVIGRFVFTRELRLLDLAKLTRIYTNASVFDPAYTTSVGRARFFRHLVREISRPVMPRDEEDEYLVTQAVAEFIAESTIPPLDGILFQSVQTAGDGHNVVLFHDASAVEPYDLPPGTKLEVSLGWASEDDHDDGISVWETTPRPPLKSKPSKTAPALPDLFDYTDPLPDPWAFDPNALPSGHPALRLEVNEIEVLRINAVKYDSTPRSLSRYRREEGYDEDFTEPVMFQYFAYGSNMSSARLRFRVPGCRALGVATLVGYELRFHKASKDGSAKCDAFATGDPGTSVVGVLYDIPRSQKAKLDAAEGLGNGYDDAAVTVIGANGTALEAITYLADAAAIDNTRVPYTWYKDFVSTGAAEHKLPADYVASRIASAPAVADPDPERDKRSRAEVARPLGSYL